MHSIRTRIMAVTIAGILTSVLALGCIFFYTFRAESDRSSVEKLALISENERGKLNAYLDSIKQSVDMGIHMADDSLNKLDIDLLGTSHTPEELEKLDAILTEHCSEVEHAFASVANNTSGIVTFYYCINSDLGSSEHGFFWSNLNEDEFVEQPPLISTDLDINDLEHTTWYYSPLKAGRQVWVGPYKAHYLGERLTISYVAPVYKYGFLIGVLGMDILYDTMVSLIRDTKVYETGFVFLMDRDGLILYHPFLEMGSRTRADFSEEELELFSRSSSGDSMIRYYANGEERQIAFSTLTNHTKVAVTAPVSEITLFQRQLSRLYIFAAVIILGVFTVISLLIMDAIIKPLLRLTAASQKLAEGDDDVVLEYKGQDEVAIMTRSFSQMRDRLKLYISDLNSRVYIDALTGVKNKGAFDIFKNQINDQILHSGKEDLPEFSVIMFDCDSLKQVNDENGHDRGDIYIQAASAIMLRIFSKDNVFRIGGDEFAVILRYEENQNREKLIVSFDRMVEAHNAAVENPWEMVRLSKGLAVFQPGSDRNFEQVLHRADQLMYEEKRRSKNQQ